MREIKFRGLDFYYRVKAGWGENVWRFGDLSQCKNGDMRINDKPRACGYGIVGSKVIPETIGQYTGLKDKNGKEIYEGDIVNAWIDLGPGGEKLAIYVVEITPFGCTLQEWTYECEGFLPEVIGNIHDNPELLEEPE